MNTADKRIKPRDGIATYKGTVYYLVDRYTMRDEQTGRRMINAVAEKASELDVGYFPMTLLIVDDKWKRGGEALEAIPNGDYDWIMREQKGYLTPPRGYCGSRCHDC